MQGSEIARFGGGRDGPRGAGRGVTWPARPPRGTAPPARTLRAMLLGIDHLVIAVPDPDAAAAELEPRSGWRPPAADATSAGTYNRLVFLGDAYLELIGAWDRALALGHPIGAAVVRALDAGAPGLATYALATDGARREVWRCARPARRSPTCCGLAVGPTARCRLALRLPAGARSGGAAVPHRARAEPGRSGERGRRARAALVHPFGGTARLVGLELAVPDPAALAAAYARPVGVAFRLAPAPDSRRSRSPDRRAPAPARPPVSARAPGVPRTRGGDRRDGWEPASSLTSSAFGSSACSATASPGGSAAPPRPAGRPSARRRHLDAVSGGHRPLARGPWRTSGSPRGGPSR